jgi:DNA primase
MALIEAVQKNPKLSSIQLMRAGTAPNRVACSTLAEKEWLIDADNLEQQFFDTITSLSARQRERSLEQLLRKARQGELSAEEKISCATSKSQFPASNPTSTGA